MARDRSDTGIVELQIVTDCSNMPQACDGLAHVAAPVCLSVAGTCWGWVGTMVLPTLCMLVMSVTYAGPTPMKQRCGRWLLALEVVSLASEQPSSRGRETYRQTCRFEDPGQPNAVDRHAAEIGNVENGSPVWGAYFVKKVWFEFSQSSRLWEIRCSSTLAALCIRQAPRKAGRPAVCSETKCTVSDKEGCSESYPDGYRG